MTEDDPVAKLQAEEQEHLRRLAACREDIARLRGELGGPEPVPGWRFVKEGGDDFTWLLGSVIAEGSVGLLVADAGVGKSTLLVQVGLSLAAGIDALGLTVSRPTPTLVIQAEGSRLAFRNRLLATKQALGISLGAVDWFIQPADCTDYQIGSPGLEALIAKSSAKFVVLDTLGYFHKGDENSANDWKAHVMRPLRSLVGKYGCSFVLVHHQVKQNVERTGWQKGRGTSAMFADADFWLRLEGAAEGDDPARRDLWLDKSKYSEMGYRIPLVFEQRNAFFRRIVL